MMKVIVGLFVVFLFMGLSSAVVINEFVVDPQSDWDGSGSATTSDEWIELYNPSGAGVDVTNWTIVMNDSLTTGAGVEILDGVIGDDKYLVILNPDGSMSNSGSILLYDELGVLVDSVVYGDWDDGNVSDNAPEGGADSYQDECLARIPNGIDSDGDTDDFVKTECTFERENRIISSGEQDVTVTIGGVVVFNVFPRVLDFGTVEPGSVDNNATNGPIVFDVNGSTTDVMVEVTNVTGYPFEDGLKIDGQDPIGLFWEIVFSSPIATAEPTLDVPQDAQPGTEDGTIVYTVTGLAPQ